MLQTCSQQKSRKSTETLSHHLHHSFTRAPVLLAGPVITTAAMLHARQTTKNQPQSPRRGAACMDACCTTLTHARTHPLVRSAARSKCDHDFHFHSMAPNLETREGAHQNERPSSNHATTQTTVVGSLVPVTGIACSCLLKLQTHRIAWPSLPTS